MASSSSSSSNGKYKKQQQQQRRRAAASSSSSKQQPTFPSAAVLISTVSPTYLFRVVDARHFTQRVKWAHLLAEAQPRSGATHTVHLNKPLNEDPLEAHGQDHVGHVKDHCRHRRLTQQQKRNIPITRAGRARGSESGRGGLVWVVGGGATSSDA